MFIIECIMDGAGVLFKGVTTLTAINLGANIRALLQAGEIWRLVTAAFLHANLIHLALNMYSLYIVGSQIETFLGKVKFLIIYFISAIAGCLLSAVSSGSPSVGASGAIFGLLGALLYFGYHYRTYLGNVVKTQILPIIVLNLAIGFMSTSIDNFAHIGGLIGGIFTTMALGVDGRSKTYEKINGFLCLIIFIGFLSYLLFFA